MCTRRADSCCIAETTATLQSSYPPVKKIFLIVSSWPNSFHVPLHPPIILTHMLNVTLIISISCSSEINFFQKYIIIIPLSHVKIMNIHLWLNQSLKRKANQLLPRPRKRIQTSLFTQQNPCVDDPKKELSTKQCTEERNLSPE